MLAENLDRWVQETKAEGWAEGWVEGRAERRAEDVIETTRKNLLSFLEIKLGRVPVWLRCLTQDSADVDVLDQALQTAYCEQDLWDSLPKLGRVLEGTSSRDAIRALIPSPSLRHPERGLGRLLRDGRQGRRMSARIKEAKR
ncbi:MAG: hypothetical protein J5863_07475 [Desulfovibrio sp.]|nr:hypothetical protein [Desulfovibrio sp.]